MYIFLCAAIYNGNQKFFLLFSMNDSIYLYMQSYLRRRKKMDNNRLISIIAIMLSISSFGYSLYGNSEKINLHLLRKKIYLQL